MLKHSSEITRLMNIQKMKNKYDGQKPSTTTEEQETGIAHAYALGDRV